MNEIRIQQFKGYHPEDLREYLDLLSGDCYRLFFPKTKALYEDPLVEIAHEYVCMTWFGERVCALGDDFVYYLPRLDRRSVFSFEVRSTDKAALASILADALDLLDERSERGGDLSEIAYELWGCRDAYDCACPEYHVIACHFLVHEPGQSKSK